MRPFWSGFYWGPPSHRRVAWLALLAGVAVLVLPAVIILLGSGGQPIFLLSLVFVGASEVGWAVELLPRERSTLAGRGRIARWLCAVVGLLLSGLSVLFGAAPFWSTVAIVVFAGLLVVEMAPGGYANRP